jgi:hypothetical protein
MFSSGESQGAPASRIDVSPAAGGAVRTPGRPHVCLHMRTRLRPRRLRIRGGEAGASRKASWRLGLPVSALRRDDRSARGGVAEVVRPSQELAVGRVARCVRT